MCIICLQPLVQLTVQNRDIKQLNSAEYSKLAALFKNSAVSYKTLPLLLSLVLVLLGIPCLFARISAGGLSPCFVSRAVNVSMDHQSSFKGTSS